MNAHNLDELEAILRRSDPYNGLSVETCLALIALARKVVRYEQALREIYDYYHGRDTYGAWGEGVAREALGIKESK